MVTVKKRVHKGWKLHSKNAAAQARVRKLSGVLSTFAVQKTHIHFGRQRGGIKLFNHFYRCAGISRQGQQVDIAAVNQTEGNGAVAQAVKRAVVAMRPLFKVQVFQYPVEAPTHNIQNQPTVFDFRKNT